MPRSVLWALEACILESLASSPATNVQWGWMGLVPQFDNLQAGQANIASLSLGGGSNITGSTGSGSLVLSGSGSTGSGNAVFANTPTLITPNLGAATGTSLTDTGQACGVNGTTCVGDAGLDQGSAEFKNTSAPTDAKRWQWYVDTSGTWTFRAVGDTSGANNLLSITRTGMVPQLISAFVPISSTGAISASSGGFIAGGVSGVTASYEMTNSGAGADLKRWQFYTDTSGTYHGRAVGDSAGANEWMNVTRIGFVPQLVTFAVPISATMITSTVATGTAPLSVTSTTPVSNLTLAGESQVTNLVSDLALKAPVASPTFTTQATAPKFIGVIAGESDVAYSATPTFVSTSNLDYISLTGNVTSSTLAAGANGQTINLVICQDATGSRTFTWPANVRGGGTIGSAASTCSTQRFTYVGPLSKWVSAGAIQTGL